MECIVAICFTAVAFQIAPVCPTEWHLSIFALSLKNKWLLKSGVHANRQTYMCLPLNRHSQICSKHFDNAGGRRLYPDKVSLLFFQKPFISTSNKRRKTPRYQSSSLGDEPVTIVVPTTCTWSKRPSTCASSKVPEIVSSSPPTSLLLDS